MSAEQQELIKGLQRLLPANLHLKWCLLLFRVDLLKT